MECAKEDRKRSASGRNHPQPIDAVDALDACNARHDAFIRFALIIAVVIIIVKLFLKSRKKMHFLPAGMEHLIRMDPVQKVTRILHA